MNRRGFLGALAGLPIAAVVQPRVAASEIVTPASLTAKGLSPAHARVFLDRVEVTRLHVLAAQLGQGGFIEILARDQAGAVHAINGTLPRVRLYGDVELRFVKADV